MPKTQKSNKSLSQEDVNLNLGKSYYNIMEVLKGKVMSNLIERSEELNLDRTSLERISFLVGAEVDSAKSWGYDQLKLK